MPKRKIETPYRRIRKAAEYNAKVKKSPGSIQLRLSLAVLGIAIAILFNFFPHLLFVSSKEPSCQKYAVMIDAGSAGSRIHVYHFHQCHKDDLVQLKKEELFAQTIPGLSAYDPEQAARSLDSLLIQAMESVPEHLHSSTPLAVKATAGLRLVGPDLSMAIINSVKSHLETHYPFPIADVSIMDGSDEGVYAWITINFLLNNTSPSAAVLDLGGGSTQIVFESLDEQLPEGDHKVVLNTGHVLYQHSYLGYGLMEARKRMHQYILSSSPSNEHVCLPQGLQWEYTKLTEDPVYFLGLGSFDDCTQVADTMFDKIQTASCELSCSFGGVYQPAISKGPIYIFSYFYDRTQPLGLPSSFYLPQLAALTESVCSGEFLENVTDIALKDELLDRPEWCLDLTFIYRLLSYGYEIPLDREITIAKKINGVETGWCLGAAIAMLN